MHDTSEIERRRASTHLMVRGERPPVTDGSVLHSRCAINWAAVEIESAGLVRHEGSRVRVLP